jgi:murein DD-endopeptidase MepM/ murein hydrolase activator NlpD
MRYRRHHNGIDIASPTGTPIYAARDGVVTFAGRRGGYGLVVYVEHGDGYTTVYGHASSLHVKVGERVRRGELIARVGCTGSCTGAHLHFEVHEGGTPVNPLRHLR